MTTTFPLPQSLKTHIPASCANCLRWMGQHKIHAWASGSAREMAQCMNDCDDRTPHAEVQGPFETAVFTHAESSCPAFMSHPDAEAGNYTMEKTCHSQAHELPGAAWV